MILMGCKGKSLCATAGVEASTEAYVAIPSITERLRIFISTLNIPTLLKI